MGLASIAAGLGRFFTSILTYIVNAIKWIGDLVVAVFVSLWDIFKDILCWGLEGLLKIVKSVLIALPAINLPDVESFISALPTDALNVLGMIGVDSALQIILGACLAKIALQLVPFTRLGS